MSPPTFGDKLKISIRIPISFYRVHCSRFFCQTQPLWGGFLRILQTDFIRKLNIPVFVGKCVCICRKSGKTGRFHRRARPTAPGAHGSAHWFGRAMAETIQGNSPFLPECLGRTSHNAQEHRNCQLRNGSLSWQSLYIVRSDAYSALIRGIR